MSQRKSDRSVKQTLRFFQPTQYMLFYIPEEKKYFSFSTVSKWWHKDIDVETLRPKQSLHFRDCDIEFDAIYITHSSCPDEIEIKKSRLAKQLDKLGDLNASSNFSFLDNSAISEIQDNSFCSETIHELPAKLQKCGSLKVPDNNRILLNISNTARK